MAISAMDEKKCVNCKFFDKDKGSGYTICIRYPPKVSVDIFNNEVTLWPEVKHNEYCGEYCMEE